MPLDVLKTVSQSRNGVSAFVLACKKMDFHYCDWAGASRGMNSFLSSPLFRTFAASYPSIEFTVSPRPHRHPIIKATYVNGREKAVCVRNLAKEQILQKAELLGRQATGEKLRRRAGRKVVDSSVGGGREGRSTRGVWSPFHNSMESIITAQKARP